MITVRTHLYKRKHRSGTVSWMVRWKDPITEAWKTCTGGRSKDEARIIESKIRDQLLMGKDPQTRPNQPSKTIGLISNLIDEYYENARYLSLSKEWKEAVKSQMERIIRPNFGKYCIQVLPKDIVYKIYFTLKDSGLSHSIIQKYHYKLRVC